jgi:hypothetical protein
MLRSRCFRGLLLWEGIRIGLGRLMGIFYLFNIYINSIHFETGTSAASAFCCLEFDRVRKNGLGLGWLLVPFFASS